MKLRTLTITIPLIAVAVLVCGCGTFRFKAQGTVESVTPPTVVEPRLQPSPPLGTEETSSPRAEQPTKKQIRLELLEQ